MSETTEVIIPVAVKGALELAKLAFEVIETWKNNPADQTAYNGRFNKMVTYRHQLIDGWEASKEANGQ